MHNMNLVFCIQYIETLQSPLIRTYSVSNPLIIIAASSFSASIYQRSMNCPQYPKVPGPIYTEPGKG